MIDKISFMRQSLELSTNLAENESQLISKAPINVPKIAPFADWDYYYLLAPIGWEPVGVDIDKFAPVKAPRGFVTDLASIPKAFWGILPPAARYTHPAIIHDYHYWKQGELDITRKQADEVFRIGMEELGVSTIKITTIYQAVRKGGGFAWKKNAKLKEKGESRFLRKFPEDPTITWKEWKSRPDVFKFPK